MAVAKKYEAALAVAKTYEATLAVAKTYEVRLTMSSEECFQGNSMSITGTFTTVATGAVIDPSSVTFKAKNEAGTTSYVYGVASEVSKTSPGIYVLAVVTNEDGYWTVQCQGDAATPVAAVNQETFFVKPAL